MICLENWDFRISVWVAAFRISANLRKSSNCKKVRGKKLLKCFCLSVRFRVSHLPWFFHNWDIRVILEKKGGGERKKYPLGSLKNNFIVMVFHSPEDISQSWYEEEKRRFCLGQKEEEGSTRSSLDQVCRRSKIMAPRQTSRKKPKKRKKESDHPNSTDTS